jgi:hypothetical protein
MKGEDVYFTTEEENAPERVTKTRSGEKLDEIVAKGEMTHLERLKDETAYLGVEFSDGEYRKFLIRAVEDELYVIPYEEKSDSERAGVGK